MGTNADTRISQLGKANTLTGAELVPMTQNINGVLTTVQATTQQIQQQLGVSSLNPVFTGTATIPNATGTGTWVNSGVTILSGTATVTGPFVVQNGQTGRTTAPPAGTIGEEIKVFFTGTSLTNGTPTNLATLPLTAGVWEVMGNVQFSPSVAATNTLLYGVSQTSATQPAAGNFTEVIGSTAGGQPSALAPTTRVTLGASASVYLVGSGAFTSGTMTATGYGRAVRVA